MNKKIRILLLGLLVVNASFGQSTVDPGITQPVGIALPKNGGDSTHHTDTVHVHFVYTGTGTINKSNSLNSYVLSNALKVTMATRSTEFNFINNWVYGKQNAVLTNNDFSSSLDMGLYKTIKHFYYWGVATYNHSVPLLINNQFQTGAGPAYNIIDKKKVLLTVSDGVIYEINDLYDSLYGVPGGNVFRRDRYNTFRNSGHLLFHWAIGDHYTLDGSTYLQNSLVNFRDYIFRVNGGASIKLYKWIVFTTAVAYSKFTRTRGQNTLFTFGVTITK